MDITIPWLSVFKEALANRSDGPLLMTLATVDPVFSVDARMVVVRDIDEAGGICFTSDDRSQKNAQIRNKNDSAAVCWLSHRREQYRFRGFVISASTPDENKRIWDTLSRATQESFFWPQPGSNRSTREFPPAPANLEQPPSNFSLLRLMPRSIDVLQLKSFPHQRWLWTLTDSDWRSQEINP